MASLIQDFLLSLDLSREQRSFDWHIEQRLFSYEYWILDVMGDFEPRQQFESKLSTKVGRARSFFYAWVISENSPRGVVLHQLLALSTNDHGNCLSVEFFLFVLILLLFLVHNLIQNSSTVIEKEETLRQFFFSIYTQLQDSDAIPGFLIYLCAGFTTSTPAVEFSPEESIASHRDGTKADEGERSEDEKAKHVGVGHGDH